MNCDKRMDYIIKKFLISCIINCMIMTSFSIVFLSSVGAVDIVIDSTPVTKTTDTNTPETITTDTSTTETKTTDTSTSDTKTTDTSTTETKTTDIKDVEKDEAINSAVDWLKDNYDNHSSYDNVMNSKEEDSINIEIKVEKKIGNISVGENVIVRSDKSDQISIDKVEFVTSTDCKNVIFTVAKLEDKPKEINEEPISNGIIYKYLDIKLTSNGTYLHEEEFKSMKFEFKVEKTWIINNNIDKETVILMRFHDGWQHLSTILLHEDDNYIYYESETPGLSTYTVVGTQIVEASPALVKERSSLPLTGWIAIIMITSIILITVVYKLRFIYKTE